MPRVPTTTGMRRLRIALLAAIAILIAGVAALFLLGRSSRQAIETAVAETAEKVVPLADDAAAVLSEGFDYEQQVAGQPVFQLRGERFTTDRSGKVALDGVRLVLYRDGEPYEVSSRKAIYDPETQDAELEGDVEVRGGEGWELSGQRLDLAGKKNVVVSRGGSISFRRGESLSGSARRLTYQIDERSLSLAGAVRVRGVRPSDEREMALAAEVMTWSGDASTVAALGGVELTTSSETLRSRRLDGQLAADGGSLETATATDDVQGTFGTEEGLIEFAAERAKVDFDVLTGDPKLAALFGERLTQPAQLVLGREGPIRRRLAAPVVRVEFLGGRPHELEASRGVELSEESGDGSRTASAEELRAELTSGGDLAHAQLSENVRLIQGGWTVTGERAELRRGGAVAEVTGRPSRASGEQGTLEAPTLTFDRERARLDAAPRVRASFLPEAGRLAGSRGESAEAPVAIESHEASFLDASRQFEFRGEVKAAQGESLLFADRLSGSESGDSAIATGNVRTQWTDRAPLESGGAALVTVVTAGRLDYRRDAGEARYDGGVLVRQGRRELASDELLVEFDDTGDARRLLATGTVRLRDHETGRSVEGASADYDLESGQAIVVGTPVVLREASGTVLRGRRALFDQSTGSTRLLSETP